jgi:hypothetical protein
MKPTILVTGGTSPRRRKYSGGARRETSIPCAAMLGAGSSGRRNTLPSYDKAVARPALATSGGVLVLTARLAFGAMAEPRTTTDDPGTMTYHNDLVGHWL